MLVTLAIERVLAVLATERMLAELPLLPMLENGFEVELEVDVVDPGPPWPNPSVLANEGVVLLGLVISSSGEIAGCHTRGDGLVPGGEDAMLGGGG